MAKQSKTYVGWVNDHSGSMAMLATAARDDFNANMSTVKNAATAEMLDTVVSVFGIGGYGVDRQVVVSNPHVLEPVTTWRASGGTPLFSGTLELIKMFESLPDANESHVNFLIRLTTDGEDTSGAEAALAAKIAEKQRLGNWTFTARIPRNGRRYLNGLNIPAGNITEWDTTEAGLRAATAQDEVATRSFFAATKSGAKSSSVFYTNAAAVNTQALKDISAETTLYINGQKSEDFDGIEIKDFILARRQQYLVGAAFYQLVKLEARVQPNKLILIREKSTGKVYAGAEARKMIGLDTVNNARVHPQHGGADIDIFIQSTSTNRKIGTGHGVLYLPSHGRPMTQADLDKYAKAPVAAPVAPKLAEAPAPGQSTKSTIPVTPKPATHAAQVNGKFVLQHYATREQARQAGRAYSPAKFVQDISDFPGNALPFGRRWFLFA